MTRIQSTHRYILLLILGLIGSMIQAFAQNNPVYVNPNVAQAGTDLFFCDTPTSQPLAVEIINPIMTRHCKRQYFTFSLRFFDSR